MFSERLKRVEMNDYVTKVAEGMVVKSEWRENLKHVASDITELSSEFIIDIDGIVG